MSGANFKNRDNSCYLTAPLHLIYHLSRAGDAENFPHLEGGGVAAQVLREMEGGDYEKQSKALEML